MILDSHISTLSIFLQQLLSFSSMLAYIAILMLIHFVFLIMNRTDNSIKNHWNCSMKKRFDFYMANGKLPPSPKFECHESSQTEAKLTSQERNFFLGKGSDKSTNFSLLVDSCKLENRMDLENPAGVPVGKGDSAVDYRTQTVEVDPICNKAVSEEVFGKGLKMIGINQDKRSPSTILDCESSPMFDLICYEPLQLEDFGASVMFSQSCKLESHKRQIGKQEGLSLTVRNCHLGSSIGLSLRSDDSDVRDKKQSEEIGPTFKKADLGENLGRIYKMGETDRPKKRTRSILNNEGTPIFGSICYEPPHSEDLGASILRTPPSGGGKVSKVQSYQSVLKSAAECFLKLGAPSILRSSKRETQTPLSPLDASSTSMKSNDGNIDKIYKSTISTLATSCCRDSGAISDDGNSYGPSPPYQLRSKRAAVRKSLEKKLDFSLKDDDFNTNSKI